jgi:hypothetical protein
MMGRFPERKPNAPEADLVPDTPLTLGGHSLARGGIG